MSVVVRVLDFGQFNLAVCLSICRCEPDKCWPSAMGGFWLFVHPLGVQWFPLVGVRAFIATVLTAFCCLEAYFRPFFHVENRYYNKFVFFCLLFFSAACFLSALVSNSQDCPVEPFTLWCTVETWFCHELLIFARVLTLCICIYLFIATQ
jgi:hypothetical protein